MPTPGLALVKGAAAGGENMQRRFSSRKMFIGVASDKDGKTPGRIAPGGTGFTRCSEVQSGLLHQL